MDNKFLDKVLDQIVRETRIDYDKEEIQFPFLTFLTSFQLLFSSYSPFPSHPFPFSEYCKNIYGLTEEEMEYVWDKYIKSIIDKIENNG